MKIEPIDRQAGLHLCDIEVEETFTEGGCVFMKCRRDDLLEDMWINKPAVGEPYSVVVNLEKGVVGLMNDRIEVAKVDFRAVEFSP